MQKFSQRLCTLLLASLAILFSSWDTCAAQTSRVPMTPEHWVANGQLGFAESNRSRQGVLDVRKGSARLKDVDFGDGTIEFDMFMPDHGILGIRFRQTDTENAEALYFRPQKHCDKSSDCMQYMPLEHGAFEWDLFPENEAKAPIHLLTWNHVLMVVAGRKLTVYINRSRLPSLVVRRMEGESLTGLLSFGGPAQYANLVIAATATTREIAFTKATRTDGYLRNWMVSKPATLSTIPDEQLKVQMGNIPPYSTMPPESSGWREVAAEDSGIVNLSHEIGSARDGSIVSVAWAKTVLRSDRNQIMQVSVGWVREIWIYVNGNLVFSGRNIDGLQAGKVADERISLKNGQFRHPLRKGDNEVAIALDDNLPNNTQHYGWGMELRMRDQHGVQQRAK